MPLPVKSSKPKRKPLVYDQKWWPDARQRIANRDGNKCGICKKDIAGDFEIDHIEPRPRDLGPEFNRNWDRDENLQQVHPSCHSKKTAKERLEKKTATTSPPIEITIDQIVADCRALGIVGERELVLAVYLTATSRKLDKPLALIVRGSSSGGKSYVVSAVAELIPPGEMIEATRMTPTSLYYMPQGSLQHRFVVAGERSRVLDDKQAESTAAIRQMLSERRISTHTTIKDQDGKFKAVKVEQEGPIAFVQTTTLASRLIFPEDRNRALLFNIDDSQEQTREIINQIAASHCDEKFGADRKDIIKRHHNFQNCLPKDVKISVPFAKKLGEQIPDKYITSRRATTQIFSMLRAVTLLHHNQRERDEYGRLVATQEDYKIALEILQQPLSESLGVPAPAAKFYDKLALKFKRKVFSTKQATEKTGVIKKTATNYLTALQKHECVKLVTNARGPKPATWQLNGHGPDKLLLPGPDSLQEVS
jgi:hypothetical protein